MRFILIQAKTMVIDNSTAVGITNNTINQHRSNATDIQFYWILDRVAPKKMFYGEKLAPTWAII